MTCLVAAAAIRAIIATVTFIMGCAIAVLAVAAFMGVNFLA